METVLDYAPGMQTTAALGVVDETDVPDLLKGAGPQVHSRRTSDHMPFNLTCISCLGFARERYWREDWH